MDDLLLIADNNEPFVEYFNFGVKLVPKDVFLKDSFLKSLYKKHIFNAAILLIRSKNIYNWHIDDNRGASLNMMIRGDNSHCLFSNEQLAIYLRHWGVDPPWVALAYLIPKASY